MANYAVCEVCDWKPHGRYSGQTKEILAQAVDHVRLHHGHGHTIRLQSTGKNDADVLITAHPRELNSREQRMARGAYLGQVPFKSEV